MVYPVFIFYGEVEGFLFEKIDLNSGKVKYFKAGLDEMLNVLLNGLTKRFNLIFKFLSCA